MLTSAPVNVLLVEDNPGDARLTREMLSDARSGRFNVMTAVTLADALALLQVDDTAAADLDVVLLDLSLPDSKGLEGVLRLQAANPRLPIVVLTGLDDEALSFEAVQAGAQDYLVKGCEGEVMARAIRYAIERKRAHIQILVEKERAEFANRSKSEFLANMSHELRTPLNAIIGFSEILQNELMGPLGAECYKEYVLNIKDSGTHLLDIINDILDLSKIEAGKLQLVEEIIDLSRTVHSCTRLMEVRASNARVTLMAKVAPNLPAMRVDERKIKQILINLLSNAVKFTPEGDEVTLVATRAEGGGLEIAVSDTGIGIAPDDISKALQPFNQIDSSLSRRYNGTGLGLPLAESFARMHGGTLTLESCEGQGTCARLYLPESRVISQVA
jgi:signal transduction histidine kinase